MNKEYVYRLIALRAKRKLEREFNYTQTFSIEREIDALEKKYPEISGDLEELKALTASIRAYQDEM